MAIGRGGLRGVKRALALALGLLVFGLLATCFETRAALAQDWKFESNLSQRMGFNSNVLLQPKNEISAFSSRTTPSITLSRVGPTSDIELQGRADFTEYFGHTDLNKTDQFANVKANKALSERSTVVLEGHFSRDTTTDTEDNEDATDHFVNKQIRFIRWDVSPSWQYLLSPIDKLRLSAKYLQTTYDSQDKTDYQDFGPTITYTHDLSELSSVFGQADFSRFEPDSATNFKEDTYGGLIGYNYHPTERFTISVAAGLNYNVTHEDSTDGSSSSGSSSDIGYRFQFNTNYLINDQTSLNVALSRDTEPSGDGQARTRNRGSFGVSYHMTEMTEFTLNGSYIDDQETQSNSGVSQRIQVSPAVRWDITEALSLQASYQFRYKTFTSSGSATDNAAFITLRYALPDLNWSGF
jgi:hypothetical protein